MCIILKVICVLTLLCLVFLFNIKAESCAVRGDLRRVRSCSICILRHTLQVCADLEGDNLEWTFICFDDSWDLKVTLVYCTQNNYNDVSENFIPDPSLIPIGRGILKLEDVECDGSEANLLECSYGTTSQECLVPLYTPSNDCTNETSECSVSNCDQCYNGGYCSNGGCVCIPGYSGECCETEEHETPTYPIDSTTTSYYNSVFSDTSTPVLTKSTNSTGKSPNDSARLLLILLTSIFGGLLITIALSAMFTLVCVSIVIISRYKHLKSSIENCGIPELAVVSSTNFNVTTSFHLSSSIAMQNSYATSNEVQHTARTQESLYDEIVLVNHRTHSQEIESHYNQSLEENSLYGGLVEGEVGNSDLYEQYHRINCEIYDRIASVEPESFANESENQYYTMQDRIYYIEPPTSLPQLETVFEHCFNEINRGEIEVGEEFASGQFGVVYRAVYHTQRGDIPVAIKTLKEASDTDTKVAFMREAAILAQFQHPNVLRLIGVLTAQQPYMMVTELLKTELAELLLKFKALQPTTHGSSSSNGTNLSAQKLNLPPLLLRFAQEISAGMEHLSEKHFIHRDLAARNVLVAKDLSCRIADFGMSRELLSDSEYYTSSGGRIPLRWTAPEAIFYQKYSEKSDVWSFGMTLFEIWSLGEKPWGNDATNEEIIEGLSDGRKLSPPAGCPRDVYSVMVETWRMDSSCRPTFSVILHLLTNIHLSIASPPVSPETGPSLCLGNDPLLARDHYPDLQQVY